jgi:3-oxoacyl-[acyl-carrier-protein] synthase II
MIMKKRRVVVTGLGVVSCHGNDVNHFFECLLQGKSGITPIQGFDCSEYPTRFAGQIHGFDSGDYIEKKQARRLDPYARYAIVAGKKALESSNLDATALEQIDKNKAGILIGSGMGGMQVFSDGVETVITKGFKRLTPFFVPYIITNIGGALLAIDIGFKGPNYSISTACATANYCIYQAAEHIRRGDADIMICGGSEASIQPVGLAGFVAIGALSKNNEHPEKASRPWDKARDGFVMGEGAGVLILEDLEHALKRNAPIYAEYLGGALTCDAYHMTDPDPEGKGVAMCIHNAIKDAGISKDSINYVNAHATSTFVGDVAELNAIKLALGEHSKHVKINSTKSMIGHCLGAAGGLEAIATIQSIIHGKLHPNVNLEDPIEELSHFSAVGPHAESFKIKAAMSNSFGFGGHNSSIIFGPYHS